MVRESGAIRAPKLTNLKTVYESKDRSCVLEAQDFYDHDTKMTFTCYEPEAHSSVMGIDLQTGQVTNFSKAPGSYNEVEGIFPDGLYAAVEADRQCEQLGGTRGPGNIDIWKLKLDGTGKDFTRLTFFSTTTRAAKRRTQSFLPTGGSWRFSPPGRRMRPAWDMAFSSTVSNRSRA